MEKQGEMLAKIEISGFQQDLKAESVFVDANAPNEMAAKSVEIPSNKINEILMDNKGEIIDRSKILQNEQNADAGGAVANAKASNENVGNAESMGKMAAKSDWHADLIQIRKSASSEDANSEILNRWKQGKKKRNKIILEKPKNPAK